jgi:hypothetical protein
MDIKMIIIDIFMGKCLGDFFKYLCRYGHSEVSKCLNIQLFIEFSLKFHKRAYAK